MHGMKVCFLFGKCFMLRVISILFRELFLSLKARINDEQLYSSYNAGSNNNYRNTYTQCYNEHDF
jgi:hypothetical protein